MKMGVNLCGVELKNPVIAASGTFGFGREYDEFYDVGGLGGISVKGLTRLPRLGNPPHRITETPAGMLNSVGLQNPGVEAFLEKDLPWLLEKGISPPRRSVETSVSPNAPSFFIFSGMTSRSFFPRALAYICRAGRMLPTV